ncbi:MAG: hypothetical protein WA634_04685 [Silvibacterium sp.]
MKLHRLFTAAGLIAAVPLVAAFASLAAYGQDAAGVPAKTILTALPKDPEQTPTIMPEDVKIKVNGKSVQAENITPLRGDRAGLELVILIDSGARNSLGRQLSEIADFIKSLPPSTEIGIAYMMNGRAMFQQPFTTDKTLALRALHLPGGTAGSSASPYFCISDLAKNWPSNNTGNRREVIAITDGIDPYEVRYDPADPYVDAATKDSIRAGVVVDALYWHDMGFASRVGFLASGGQNLLTLITSNTGGMLYYQGLSNPVSFAPFFRDLSKRLDNQYELSFMAPAGKKPQVASLNVKLKAPGVKLSAPNLVFVRGNQ